MTPVPLADLRLKPSHHLSALWWLGLLYRKPKEFDAALKTLPRLRQVSVAFVLPLHVLPYAVVLAWLGEILTTLIVEPASSGASSMAIFFWERFKDAAYSMEFGVAFGVAFGIFLGIVGGGIGTGVAVGIAYGILGGAALAITLIPMLPIYQFNQPNAIMGLAWGLSSGIMLGLTVSIIGAWIRGRRYGASLFYVGILTAVLFGLMFGSLLGESVGIALGVALIISFAICAMRVYYYPAHLFFFWPALRGRAYPRHPVAWDDLCSLPFLGLHRLLLAYRERHPESGDREIERLIDTYPSQRMEALKARTILIARATAREPDLGRLDQRIADLPDGDKGFLKETATVRALVGEIAQTQRRLDTIQRQIFREPLEAQLRQTIQTFQHRVAGLREPLASEFRAAAQRWQAIAGTQHQRTIIAVRQKPALQVFRAGDPVDRANEAFIPRYPVIEALDGQIMLATGCPGLLLYGRRRMGKSTLLRNLAGFIDQSVVPSYLSMQDPAGFSSQASFAAMLGKQAGAATHPEAASEDGGDLESLYRRLGEANARLEAGNRRLLLAIDEFEMIDGKIGEGVFSPDLLAMVRESVQSHRHIIWLFAGSHGIEELTHADWPSYFVSLRTLEVPPFTREETRLLLTQPLKYSPLYRAREDDAPRFDPAFWGEDGTDFVHDQAGGWPHLVQLLAETAVDLANQYGLGRIDEAMLETVCERAIVSGDAVLRQLVERECGSAAEWEYLLAFRAAETQPPPADDQVRRALRRRLLLVEADGACRLRAPLMHRWLIERA